MDSRILRVSVGVDRAPSVVVPAGAAPTVSAIAPNFGPAAGGTSVTVTGTGFTASSVVAIGGIAATSVVVVNSTTITCTTPALTSGSVNNVQVTTSFGAGLGGSLWLAFSPADLALTGWWGADFAGAPWVAKASAGSSASRENLVADSGSVTTGTAQNGAIPAHFSSADLTSAALVTTLFSVAAGTLIALVKPSTAVAPSGNLYDDPCVYRDSNADLALTYTTSGFGVIAYDGAYKSKYVACATGAYHLVMMRWDSSNLGLTLDSASEQTVACGLLTVLTGSAIVGRGYAAGFLGMDVLDLLMINSKLSDATYAKIKAYANQRYSLSL